MGDDLIITDLEIETEDDELCEYCDKTIPECDCESDDEPDENETDVGDGDNVRGGYTKSYVDSLNF